MNIAKNKRFFRLKNVNVKQQKLVAEKVKK